MTDVTWNPQKHWEQLFSSRPWGRYPAEPIVRAVCRHVARVPRAERKARWVLDIGCGTGANAWFLANEGLSVAGIDGSETGARLASERAAALGAAVDFKAGDFTQPLPWSDSFFDIAIDCAAITCNQPSAMKRTVEEAYRVLKPNGLFVSMPFTPRTWGYGAGRPLPEPGAFIDITEGPLVGTGLVSFLTREQVDTVYGVFPSRVVERSSFTAEGDTRLIEHWVVTAVKPG